MKDIFANCSVNLCASAAADASEASFQRRNQGIIVPSLDIEPRWTGFLNCGIGYSKPEPAPLPSRLRGIRFKLVDSTMYQSEIHNAPFNLRAWVVQEHVLSRRQLYMTCKQLWWECHELCACEVFPARVLDGLVLCQSEATSLRYFFSVRNDHLGGFSEEPKDITGDAGPYKLSLFERLSDVDQL